MRFLNEKRLIKIYIHLMLLTTPLFSFGDDYKNLVVSVGNGSGVLWGKKALTARHVISQMDYKFIKGNNEALCCNTHPLLIGNADNYRLVYLPPSNELDKKSLGTGRIFFDERLEFYNDWGIVELVYFPENGPSPELASPESLTPGESLIAVGNIHGTLTTDKTIRFEQMAGNNIIFNFGGQESTFREGFSGGGLFKESGELVGILFAKDKVNNRGAATSITHIKSSLQESCSDIIK